MAMPLKPFEKVNSDLQRLLRVSLIKRQEAKRQLHKHKSDWQGTDRDPKGGRVCS